MGTLKLHRELPQHCILILAALPSAPVLRSGDTGPCLAWDTPGKSPTPLLSLSYPQKAFRSVLTQPTISESIVTPHGTVHSEMTSP